MSAASSQSFFGATDSIFAAPADSKYEVALGVTTGTAPTSSKMSTSQLTSALADPKAASMRFAGAGFQYAEPSVLAGTPRVATVGSAHDSGLTLDTRSGQLTSTEATCTEAAMGELTFSLPTLVVDKSLIRPLLSGEAAVSHAAAAKIPTSNSNIFGSASPFRMDRIVGPIYGVTASDSLLRGRGPQGGFVVVAARQ
jgi:hypothetical protein